MEKDGLLEIIAAHRMVTALDEFLKKDKSYQDALEEEQAASDTMDSLNLTTEQKKAVDRVITAYNECGAVYGAVAYRFGMEDGIGSVRRWKRLHVRSSNTSIPSDINVLCRLS